VTEALQIEEFLSAYLVEVEEHLATANTNLLATEVALRSGQSNRRAIRESFRALHTIKGLSAMVGVEAVVTLAHHMETLLRTADRSGATLPLPAVDALLQGLRAIEQRVRALGERRPVPTPPADLLAALDGFDIDHVPSARRGAGLTLDPALLAKLGPAELEHLDQGIAAGKRAVRADFVPSAAQTERGLNINSVRERVSKLAEIVKVLPQSVPVGPDAPGGLSFVLLLLTSASDEEVAAAVGVELEELSLLSRAPGDLAPPPPEQPPDASARYDEDDPEDGELRLRGVVRVDVARLDDALERLSALIVTRFRLTRAIATLTASGVNTRELVQIMNDNARQLRDLRASIFRVRMVPVSDLLDRLPLLVRGLRRDTDRLVRLELHGGGAELDKAVAERLFPAIVHLIRNAVDHAIETPDERRRRGKPEEGLLRVACSARSNTRLELSVTDDGRGIAREAVARKAGREVPRSDAALLDLLCLPGLSTRDVPTTTSGRGMGMDIVKRIAVDQLGGELIMRTELGVGTTFTLRVPLTLSIVDAFSFECGAQRFVVPVAMVEEIVELDPAQMLRGPLNPRSIDRGIAMIQRRGEAIPFLALASLFRIGDGAAQARKALVVRRGGEALAFGVDRMLGQQEVVVRPLEDALVRTPGIAGATDLGDGKPTLVLDLVALGAALSSSRLELAS
jgi:two-component system chemotaxis sensor kinase CheA